MSIAIQLGFRRHFITQYEGDDTFYVHVASAELRLPSFRIQPCWLDVDAEPRGRFATKAAAREWISRQLRQANPRSIADMIIMSIVATVLALAAFTFAACGPVIVDNAPDFEQAEAIATLGWLMVTKGVLCGIIAIGGYGAVIRTYFRRLALRPC